MFGYYEYICGNEKLGELNSEQISKQHRDLTSDILPDSVRRNFYLTTFKTFKKKNKAVH